MRNGSARYQAASTLLPFDDIGRVECELLHSSYCQSAMRPSGPSAAFACITMAAP